MSVVRFVFGNSLVAVKRSTDGEINPDQNVQVLAVDRRSFATTKGGKGRIGELAGRLGRASAGYQQQLSASRSVRCEP